MKREKGNKKKNKQKKTSLKKGQAYPVKVPFDKPGHLILPAHQLRNSNSPQLIRHLCLLRISKRSSDRVK